MGSANTSFHDGALARVLLAPFRLAFAAALGLAGVLLVAWTVDWAFVAHVWPGRVEGLRALLAQELTTGTALAARQGVAVAAVTAPANGLYALVFEATGLHEMGQRFAQGAPLPVPDTIVRSAWVARHEAVEVAMLGTQLLGLRAGILVRFLPLLVLLYAVGAAVFWALYIVFGKRAGHLHAGQSVSLGLLVAALVVVPVGVAHAGAALLSPSVLLVGVAVAAISSALPISLEMMALKRLPKEAFGIMISMEPAVAALLALALLGERLDTVQWLAIGCIVAASMGSAATARRLPAVQAQPA